MQLMPALVQWRVNRECLMCAGSWGLPGQLPAKQQGLEPCGARVWRGGGVWGTCSPAALSILRNVVCCQHVSAPCVVPQSICSAHPAHPADNPCLLYGLSCCLLFCLLCCLSAAAVTLRRGQVGGRVRTARCSSCTDTQGQATAAAASSARRCCCGYHPARPTTHSCMCASLATAAAAASSCSAPAGAGCWAGTIQSMRCQKMRRCGVTLSACCSLSRRLQLCVSRR